MVLAVIWIMLFVPESRDPHAKRLDLIGAALSLVGVSAFVYGVIEIPNAGWSDPTVLVTMVGGLALLGLLLAWLRRASNPLVDLRFFRNARFTWSSVAISSVMLILFGVLFVVPQFLQQVQGKDAMNTGLHLLPMIGALVIAAGVGGRLVGKIGAKVIVTAGMVLWMAGLGLLSTVDPDTDFMVTGTALAIMGLALGFTMPTTLDAILGSLPTDQVGAGSALANSMRQIGASVGVAVLGSALNSAYRNGVDDDISASLPQQAQEAVRDNVAGALQVAEKLPAAPAGSLADSARDAFVAGMSTVSLICAGLAAVTAVVVAVLLPARDRQPLAADEAEEGAQAKIASL